MSRLGGLVAGIGFRHAAQAQEIVTLVRKAIVTSGLPPERLCAIATAEDRAGESAIREAATAFDLEPTGVAPKALRAVDADVPTRSARIEAERGIGSLAEAAALAVAGEGGWLILPRIASGSVTCALALIPETT